MSYDYKSEVKDTIRFSANIIRIVLFLNAVTLSFVDIKYGRTLILIIAFIANIILLLSCINYRVGLKFIFSLTLIVYLCFRQIILYSSNANIYAGTILDIIFIAYVISFGSIISFLEKSSTLILIRFFIYFNLLFGLPDFFGYVIPILHIDGNDIMRFRGLATEPNLLAVPLLLCLIGIINNDDKYFFKKIDIIFCLLMIYFSYSKSAYLGLIYFLGYNYLQTLFTFKNLLKFICTSLMFVIIFNFTGIEYYLHKIPFYSNFISIIDWDLISNLQINDYIISLTALDQFQSGSLGTRLATAVASVHTIFDSCNNFLFGVGGGNSHSYLIPYIFDNGIDNFELNLHYTLAPEFITDKTYILKFFTEYGVIGVFLLFGYSISVIRSIDVNIKLETIQIVGMLFFLFLLCQSPFLICFTLIAFSAARPN